MSTCAPKPPCISPQATIAFFKGAKGDKGDPGAASTVPGPPGDQGGQGPVGVYTGTYDDTVTYYDTNVRKDIVDYAGQFWIVANSEKSGTSDWGVPNVDDWQPFGATLVNVATAIRLLVPANIAVELNIVPPGYLQSSNFVQYTTGWLATGLGRVEINDGVFIGVISTDTPRFNADSPNRTMPVVGYAEFDIPAILDAAIPINPIINNVTDNALIFFGWIQGANNFIDNRFGNMTQRFQIILEGTGSNTSAGSDLFYIQVYYRLRDNGGAWDPWVPIGQDWYMQKLAALDQSFNPVKSLSIALTGTQDIQFSAGFSKGAAGAAAVGGAKISVQAFN